jgi:DNA-binding phage protein
MFKEKEMWELAEIREALTDSNLARVAQAAGIPYGRVYRLVHRPEQAPSYETVNKVVAYLESRKLLRVA